MKPLLVYVPNTNVTTMSNVSKFVFTDDERDDLIDNGYEIPTALLDEDPEYLQCIGCAISEDHKKDLELKLVTNAQNVSNNIVTMDLTMLALKASLKKCLVHLLSLTVTRHLHQQSPALVVQLELLEMLVDPPPVVRPVLLLLWDITMVNLHFYPG
ncbi:unnamed protein product [Ambrosiozyma monospora]|uniref:Unnamed protein product n=1 Tax=Ambrosiozyma monospora TaxID=43982 RepID=A0ACB5UBW0_AMBMO|nr:unnamed protein product [Ambrosiozyma monospora]